ncbi:MAG: hypothetical protein GY816_18670, partial [Cytophagales bacterium]|nr:hypothetical protein [Cytophagales bacterium]
YIRDIQSDQAPSTTEQLSQTQKLNEYILTRTRTMWGLDLSYIQDNWDIDLVKQHNILFNELINENKGVLIDNFFRLTSKGFSFADEVALRLFSGE